VVKITGNNNLINYLSNPTWEKIKNELNKKRIKELSQISLERPLSRSEIYEYYHLFLSIFKSLIPRETRLRLEDRLSFEDPSYPKSS